MKLLTILFSLLVIASLASVSEANCYDPVAYGAIPNDHISDRAAIQAAMDDASAHAPATVCIGEGRWTVDRAPIGSYNRFAAISTHAHDLTLTGAGPATVLELVGDQGAGAVSVISIDPSATNVRVERLTIDTTGAFNTDEQTHAIATSGTCSGALCQPITSFGLDHVVFIHPKVSGERKGDCVRLLGNSPASPVIDVSIANSTFIGCARSGIEVQRNVHGLRVEGNYFAHKGDQDIDSEPTGGATDINDTTVIANNVFADDLVNSQGDYSVTIGGIGGPMSNVVVANNAFLGRGLALYRDSDTAITGNTFVATMRGTGGVISSQNVAANVVVSGNTLRRKGVAGPLIRFTPHSGGLPGDINISNNQLINEVIGWGIYLETASDVTIANNGLKFLTSDAGAGYSAIYERATAGPVDNLMIANNRISGPLSYALVISAAPYSIGDVELIGNQAKGTTVGLYCSSLPSAPVPLTITSVGNRLGTRACSAVFSGGD